MPERRDVWDIEKRVMTPWEKVIYVVSIPVIGPFSLFFLAATPLIGLAVVWFHIPAFVYLPLSFLFGMQAAQMTTWAIRAKRTRRWS